MKKWKLDHNDMFSCLFKLESGSNPTQDICTLTASSTGEDFVRKYYS